MVLTTIYSINAQCKKDPKVLEAQKRISSNNDFESQQMESDFLCKAYFELACKARHDAFTKNGKVYPRTKQHAHNIEGQAIDIIKRYEKLGANTCGKLTPLKAVYKDSIGVRNELIVGFWVTKSTAYNKTYYSEFYFDNDGHMNNSDVNSALEKSTWSKLTDTNYEVTQSWYDDYYEDYTTPKKGKFIIDPKTNTAQFIFNRSNGNEVKTTFYFKGNYYHNYGKSEKEILEPVDLTKNLKK